MSILAESVGKNKRTRNYNNNQHILRGYGFTEAKCELASKNDDSYTKGEAVAVQGAQQEYLLRKNKIQQQQSLTLPRRRVWVLSEHFLK